MVLRIFATWAAVVLMQRDDSLRLIVPGVSSERQRLQRLLQSLRLPHLALFTHRTQAFEVLLAVADVVVVAAVDDVATTPLAWAMAAGIPIVSTAVGGVPEILSDGKEALLVERLESEYTNGANPPDEDLVRRYSQALEHLLRERKLREDLSRKAFERLHREFSLEVISRRYVDLYRELGVAPSGGKKERKS